MIEAGSLNRRLTIQTRAATTDTWGQASQEWTTVARVMGRVRALYGRELAAAGARTAETTFEIVIARRQLDASARILYGDIIFNIGAVMDLDDGPRRYLRVLASTGTNQG